MNRLCACPAGALEDKVKGAEYRQQQSTWIRRLRKCVNKAFSHLVDGSILGDRRQKSLHESPDPAFINRPGARQPHRKNAATLSLIRRSSRKH